MRRSFYFSGLFLLGGSAYVLLEVAYRGYSHITMFFASGLCLVGISLCDRAAFPIWVKMLLGGALITFVELVFGLVINLALGMGVWDYSARFGNVMGQICPAYSLAWVALSLPAVLISRAFKRTLYLFSEPRE